jgi:hypothetical protein
VSVDYRRWILRKHYTEDDFKGIPSNVLDGAAAMCRWITGELRDQKSFCEHVKIVPLKHQGREIKERAAVAVIYEGLVEDVEKMVLGAIKSMELEAHYEVHYEFYDIVSMTVYDGRDGE